MTSRVLSSFAARFSAAWGRSVRRQLILGVALVHAVLMTVFVLDLVERQRAFLHRESLSQAESLAKTLAANSVSWVLANDLVGLGEVADSLKDAPNLSYAMVLDLRGRVLAHSEQGPVGAYLRDETSLGLLDAEATLQRLVVSKQQIDVAAPVASSGRLIGWARIGLNLSAHRANLDLVTRNGILYTLLAILAGTAMAVFISRRLTSGLHKLVRVAEKVRQGARSVRADEDRADEIGTLGRGFNNMLESIETSERRLLDSIRWKKIIFDNSAAGILVVTGDRIVTEVNPRICAILGYQPEELIGRSTEVFHVSHETFLAFGEDVLRLATRQETVHAEWQLRRKDGSVFWCEASGSAVDPADLAKGVIWIAIDITARKQAEEELRQAKAAAETASRAKSEFLANMSHELRTPLNGILGMLQLAKTLPLDEELGKYVDTALMAGRSLLTLINDILNLSQIEAGKVTIRSAELSVPECLQTTIQSFRHQAEAQGIRLALRMDGRIPDVLLGDEGRLRQVLFNLIGNALKFSDDKGDVLVEADIVRREEEQRRMRLLFSVGDTGIGIPAEKLEVIFEPFTQVDGSFSRRHQGVGLGLSIVRRLVSLMGGTIAIDSEVGAGTTVAFTLDFGVPDAATTAATTAASHAEAAGEPDDQPLRLRILLAEDEKINLLATQRLMEKLGHSVACARNGIEALEALRRERFDLVLMDIQMPEMDGLTATRIIRSDPDFRDKARIPIIALTAHAMMGDRVKILGAGVDDYVAKPAEMEVIQATIRRVMGKVRRAAERRAGFSRPA